MKQSKVFGIGFQKTGTTSLGVIFQRLGYRMAGYNEFREMAGYADLSWHEIEEHAIETARNIDAAKDTPWPLLYRQLDKAYPGSKFIHVTRDTDAWLKSALSDFKDYPNAIHRLIYGSNGPLGHEADWRDRYERHNSEVRSYFSDRPNDCLHLRLEDGVTFERVCEFLDEPLVGQGAPKANTYARKRVKMAWRKLVKRTAK